MTDPIRIELPTNFGMKTVNAYLFKYPEPVLIDCGEKTPASWNTLQKALQLHGLKINDLSKVVITHAHVDHMGMAGEIARHSHASIWVSTLVSDWATQLDVMQQNRGQLIDKVIRKMLPEEPNPFRIAFSKVFGDFQKFWDPIPENRLHIFDLEEKLDLGGNSWEVIYAPGHCINQTCFYQRESRQLLSADMLLAKTPTPVMDADPSAPQERVKSIFALLDSFERFAQLDINTVFPGHYEPFSNHRHLIRQQVRRIQLRKETCFSLIKDGNHDFSSLLAQLYNNRVFPPAFPMLVGYLDLLEAEGRIIAQEKAGKIQFYPT